MDEIEELNRILDRLDLALTDMGELPVEPPELRDRSINWVCRKLADWANDLKRAARDVKYRDADRYRHLKNARNAARKARGKLLRAQVRGLPPELEESFARFARASAGIDAVGKSMEGDLERLSKFASVANYGAQAGSAIWAVVRALG